MKLRAVIFDRDNTLMHFDLDRVAALEARIMSVAPALPADSLVDHWMSWSSGWPRAAHDEPAFWATFWGALAARHQLSHTATTALLELGAFYHTCFVAFPDAQACLAALRAGGLRLAVLTNFELPSIDLTLQHVGIEPCWFDALLSSAAIGHYKPDQRAYAAATAALELPPHACAFVDDLPENVAAARALGMQAWLLDRTGTATPTDMPTIHDLSELPALILTQG